jgi:hypothetical protein
MAEDKTVAEDIENTELYHHFSPQLWLKIRLWLRMLSIQNIIILLARDCG